MRIKSKMMAVTGVMLACLGAILLMIHHGNDRYGELAHSELLAAGLKADMLELRRHEKDFLARKDAKLGRIRCADAFMNPPSRCRFHMHDVTWLSDAASHSPVVYQYQKRVRTADPTWLVAKPMDVNLLILWNFMPK